MEWWLVLLLIFVSLVVLMTLGLPVAFCFMLINIIAVSIFWGGETGLRQLVLSILQSVTRFSLLPIPLFVLMGELLFHSGIATRMIDSLDKWLGRVPGRLGLLAIGGGTLLGALTGATMASTAMLGEVLTPEMERRGYRKPMSLGPILGSGGLAMMIPPSAAAVFLASTNDVSVAKLLMAGVVPGLLMAVAYATYVGIRCSLQPWLAPPYEVTLESPSARVKSTVINVLPMGIIIFAVTGVIFFGIATPTESAATGVLATLIVLASYRKLNWKAVKKSCFGTINTTGMIFMIITGSVGFSQVLAYSGASRGLAQFAANLPLPSVMLVIAAVVVLIMLGMFIGIFSMVMITMPIFIPLTKTLGIDPLWFSALVLLTMEMGPTSPPYGSNLFVMKSVAPPDTTMVDIYKAALPFLYCDIVVMALMIAFPIIPLWLPTIMR